MQEVLIHTGVYSILFIGLMNVIVLFIAYFKRLLDHLEFFSLIGLVIGITLIAGAIFFRDLNEMDWLYYAALLAGVVGSISLLLRIAKKLIRKPNR